MTTPVQITPALLERTVAALGRASSIIRSEYPEENPEYAVGEQCLDLARELMAVRDATGRA